MKYALLFALPAVILLALAVGGCDDETQPVITRLTVFPSCGVVPLEVEGYVTVSGGNETGDPTGGTNNLEVKWDFGDGTTGSTAVSYHDFTEPGDYVIRVTATDPDGKSATASCPVSVRADTLEVNALSNFHGELVNADQQGLVTIEDIVFFDVWASACEIDPDNEDHYRRLTFEWHMNDVDDTVFYGQKPYFTFPVAGDYQVTLTVTYPELAATRHSTLDFTVIDP